MASPIVPWIGGKRKLAEHILPLFPAHTCYVEPFCGAAALFFMKQPSACEVINDVNGDIVNLYRVVKHHLEELVRQFKWSLTSREHWNNLRDTPPHTLTDVQRAARFLYLQKLAFGARVDGQNFGTATTGRPRFNLLSIEEDLTEAHFRLSQATIEHLDWHQVITRYDRPHTLFYCDPPYWQTEGYGVEFAWEQYERLREVVGELQGRMLISINAHADIRELFSDLPCMEIEYEYTVGGSSSSQRVTELVYASWGSSIARQRDIQSALF